jgi:hypothetical protein
MEYGLLYKGDRRQRKKEGRKKKKRRKEEGGWEGGGRNKGTFIATKPFETGKLERDGRG